MNLTDNQKLIVSILGGATVGLGAFFLSKELTKQKSQKKELRLTENLIGIEMGGTGSKISVINKRWNNTKNKYDYQVVNRFGCDSTTPEETVTTLLDFIKGTEFTQVGIASFGPVCLNKSDPAFGSITSTPKLQWQNFPIRDTIKKKTGCENVFIDTDVNAAALAEYELGTFSPFILLLKFLRKS